LEVSLHQRDQILDNTIESLLVVGESEGTLVRLF